MKYFKFWIKESFKINVDGEMKEINLIVGSNESKADASELAKMRAKNIETKIAGKSAHEEYEVSIKEHVADIMDEKNIVTVNRYGAEVLNTSQYTILDLDEFPVDFLDFFKPIRKLPKKERIVAKFHQRIAKHPELGTDFRIYETAKGIRIIGKNYVDPVGKRFFSIMKPFCVDWIYQIMSIKQACYRARLTPKPFRIHMKPIRIKSPLDCETEAYLQWVKEYNYKSTSFSVVKLLETIGSDFSRDPVIKRHDEKCRMNYGNKLA
jgi:hypothetical protein